MTGVKAYQAVERILRKFVLHRVHVQSDEYGQFTDLSMSYREIDQLLKNLDAARGTGEEPDGADGLKDAERILLPDIGGLMPIIAGTHVARRLRDIDKTLKISAQADVIRAIIDCRRVLLETCGSEWGDQTLDYLESLRELEKNLAAEPGEPDQEPEPAKDTTE